jgi:hypothetical protein
LSVSFVRFVRHLRNDMSIKNHTQQNGRFSRMVTVTTSVPARQKSVQLRQRRAAANGTSTSASASINRRPGMPWDQRQQTAADTSASSSTAEKTDASGVCAPASRLGMDRFMDHRTRMAREKTRR